MKKWVNKGLKNNNISFNNKSKLKRNIIVKHFNNIDEKNDN